jgi:hypothetical protein
LTSSRRSPARPVRHAELRVSFAASREEFAKIREAVPSAVLKRGTCVVVIEGGEPFDVADRARDLLERVRVAVEKPPAGKRL